MATNKDGQLSYPSPAEVKIFIDGNWVDDAYRVDYAISTPRTPLYDYTSRFYKHLADGHTTVQGQLIINFRFPGYLQAALDNKLFRDPRVLKALEDAGDMYRDLAVGTAEDKLRTLMEMKAQGSLKPAKQVSQSVWGTGPHAVPGVSLDASARTHKNVLSQQDIDRFDLEIWYGGEEANYSHAIRDCVIIGESQVISAAAMAGGDLSASSLPIFEVYSFFAKRVESRIHDKSVLYERSTTAQSVAGSDNKIRDL